ncbi:hypothetical protein ACK3Y8_21630 [Aeromonas caviae]
MASNKGSDVNLERIGSITIKRNSYGFLSLAGTVAGLLLGWRKGLSGNWAPPAPPGWDEFLGLGVVLVFHFRSLDLK